MAAHVTCLTALYLFPTSRPANGMLRSTPPKFPRVATLAEADDAETVVALVRRMDAGGGSEELTERIARLFAAFPPTQRQMQRLSVLQQQEQHNASEVAFCVATLYMVASNSLCERLPAREKLVRRSQSCPDLDPRNRGFRNERLLRR